MIELLMALRASLEVADLVQSILLAAKQENREPNEEEKQRVRVKRAVANAAADAAGI